MNSRSAIRSVQFRLCTNESAWKLKATFFRTPLAHFASNEIWVLPQLAIPDAGTARILTGSNTWQGVTVNLCAIAGPGDITYSNGVPVRVAPWSGGRSGSSSGRVIGGAQVSDVSVATDKSQFMIRVAGLREEARFQVFARTAGSTTVCPESSSSGEYKLLQLETPDGTGMVDLTFVVQQPAILDFLIRPEWPASQ